MASVIEIEQAAARLRRHLKLAQRPDLKLICGLRFFDLFRTQQAVYPESYLREFLPALAQAAGKCNARDLLPEDADSLAALIALVVDCDRGMSVEEDLASLRRLDSALAAGVPRQAQAAAANDSAVRVPCLFVEYYPDLDLPPRGRILDLYVTASPISARADADDIVVRNPVAEPDDRFLAQARDSVAAARKYLADRYGLSPNKRYRFDFAVDSTGARFTGDSLGAAFAVGAIVAVAQIEVFRERLSIASNAAFSGALMPDGQLNQIDPEALKLKIYRAFHSDLKLLVIPREHITDAWVYLSELEGCFPGRKLELVGAESLYAIASDPRLVPPQRSSAPAYLARKAWRAKRSAWVEYPAALLLAAILFYIIAPARWFDNNPSSIRLKQFGFDVLNKKNARIWSKTFAHTLNDTTTTWAVDDINLDGKNEVVFIPKTNEPSDENANLFVYEGNGTLKFRRECAIFNEYPDDSSSDILYNLDKIEIKLISGRPIIKTFVYQSLHARAHIIFWDSTGAMIGWYINSGHAGMVGDNCVVVDSSRLAILGYNNRLDATCLFIVAPDSIQGVSPPYSGINGLELVKRGTQISYIVFPRTDVSKKAGGSYNNGRGIRIDPFGIIRVHIDETDDLKSDVFYYLDRDYRVVNVDLGDAFITKRNNLIDSGKVQNTLSPIEYGRQMRDAVMYWTDSGWVTEGQLRRETNRHTQ